MFKSRPSDPNLRSSHILLENDSNQSLEDSELDTLESQPWEDVGHDTELARTSCVWGNWLCVDCGVRYTRRCWYIGPASGRVGTLGYIIIKQPC